MSEPLTPSPISTAELLRRWEVASAESRAALSGRLVLAFLGSASSGKDSAVRALFGVDFGEIDPIPGSTSRARAIALGPQLVVVNAPGFGDLRAEVEAEARALISGMDLAIYLVNCDGGATIDERRDLDALRALGRPVLVCLNKIDLIRGHQRAAFVSATLAQLGVQPADAVVTAFDPLPALADAPVGVAEVAAWLTGTLEKQGKALLFARHLRDRALAAIPIIDAAARRAALAGAIPVPGADMAAVSAVQVKLISDLAALYDQPMERDLVLFILGEVLAGSSKGFVRWAMDALKVAGWIPGNQLVELATSALGATLAGAATWGAGRAADTFLRRRAEGRGMSGDELRQIFDAEAFKWKDERGGRE